MRRVLLFLLIGGIVLGFGCKNEKEASNLLMSEGFVTVDEGVVLRYKTIGDGPETVIIPAAIYMEYEFEQLAAPSRTLIFYDQRGRGKSSAIASINQISMDVEISDLEAIRRHFGKEKISLIGWSYLGGMVVLYASRYPEHINRIVQIGPLSPTYEIFQQSLSTPFDSESAAQLQKLKEVGLDESDPERFCTQYWHIYMKRIFHDPGKIDLFRSDKCKCRNEMPANTNLQLMAIIGKLKQWDWREMVMCLDVPVLTIHGESDTLPIEGSQVWVSSLGNARFLVIREAGHLPFVEQPEVFYPPMDVFLKGGWPANAEVLSAH